MGYMLDLMAKKRVFYVEKGEPLDFTIGEACDYNFFVDMTATELRNLGQELIDMADSKKG